MINRTVTLNNGIEMPLLGLGIYTPGEQNEVRTAVSQAIEEGYRLLDTASIYQNETEVGQGIKDSGINREKLFITSKVWNDEQGYDNTLKAYDASLKNLQTDYLDLYLIHWPIRELRKDTWLALEKLYADKRVRAIGVSNYYQPHLDELNTYSTVVPAVNQFEFHPCMYLPELLEQCKAIGIQPEGYSPLIRGKAEDNEVITTIANQHGKSTYQVLIRWSMQHGVVTIPKSTNKERLRANFEVWDFELTEDNMRQLNSFQSTIRIADDPMTYL